MPSRKHRHDCSLTQDSQSRVESSLATLTSFNHLVALHHYLSMLSLAGPAFLWLWVLVGQEGVSVWTPV